MGPQSHDQEQLNSANFHVSLKEDPKLQIETRLAYYDCCLVRPQAENPVKLCPDPDPWKLWDGKCTKVVAPGYTATGNEHTPFQNCGLCFFLTTSAQHLNQQLLTQDGSVGAAV